jgi:hypothetical protein
MAQQAEIGRLRIEFAEAQGGLMSEKLPREIHREKYQGVEFAINETKHGLMSYIVNMKPRWGHFCRYVEIEEGKNLTPANMRRAIDRMLADSPVYSGDLRDRY